MNKSKIFLAFSLCFILAVGLQSWWDFSFWIVPLLILALSLLAVFWKNQAISLISVLMIIFVGGIWRTNFELSRNQNLNLVDKKIEQIAIVQKVEKKDSHQKILAYFILEKEKVLINESLNFEYDYGEKIQVQCVLKVPDNQNNFDYRMYLAKDRIKYVCEKTKIKKIGQWGGNRIYGFFLKIKKVLEQSLNQSMPYPESVLAEGMLFGGNSSMLKSTQEAFSRTGMTHIVAVSGYNVTIIAEYLILIGIFLGLWRQQALWVAILGIFIFVVMIGFPASAVRAGVMGTILIWAIKNGRLANSLNAIIFSAGLMLFFNPLLLRYDIGFQLSFLATLGIILFSPLAEKLFLKKNNSGGLSEIILLSICAQILVLPIIAYNFQTFSTISLLANVLILPIIPFSMLLSFLASVVGIFVDPVFNVLAWLAYLPLFYEIKVINYLASFSQSSLTLENFGFREFFIYYVLLGMVVFFFKFNMIKINFKKILLDKIKMIRKNKN